MLFLEVRSFSAFHRTIAQFSNLTLLGNFRHPLNFENYVSSFRLRNKNAHFGKLNFFFIIRRRLQQQRHGPEHIGRLGCEVQLPEQERDGAIVQDRNSSGRHLLWKLRQGGLPPQVRQQLRRRRHGLRDSRGNR